MQEDKLVIGDSKDNSVRSKTTVQNQTTSQGVLMNTNGSSNTAQPDSIVVRKSGKVSK